MEQSSMLLTAVLFGLCSGLTAAVYKSILLYQQSFDWWRNLVNKFEKYYYIHAPLIGCIFCISGQLALWSFGVCHWRQYDNPVAWFGLIVAISTSILTGSIIKNFIDKNIDV